MIVQQIIVVLARLKQEGLAILLVEQSLETGIEVGDRHHVMNKGEICFTGSAEELVVNDFVLRNYLSVRSGVRGLACKVLAWQGFGAMQLFRQRRSFHDVEVKRAWGAVK